MRHLIRNLPSANLCVPLSRLLLLHILRVIYIYIYIYACINTLTHTHIYKCTCHHVLFICTCMYMAETRTAGGREGGREGKIGSRGGSERARELVNLGTSR
jgi:hypothetical protein